MHVVWGMSRQGFVGMHVSINCSQTRWQLWLYGHASLLLKVWCQMLVCVSAADCARCCGRCSKMQAEAAAPFTLNLRPSLPVVSPAALGKHQKVQRLLLAWRVCLFARCRNDPEPHDSIPNHPMLASLHVSPSVLHRVQCALHKVYKSTTYFVLACSKVRRPRCNALPGARCTSTS